MKHSYRMKYRRLVAPALGLLALLLLAPPAARAESARVEAFVFEGVHFQVPGLQLGFEVITEGTANYTIERTMRNLFPFDTNLTVIGAWGYTGDKLTIKVTDLGGTGDRLFASATAVVNGRATTEWGTMYSSASQSSFEVTVPMDSPGGIVYLLTGYFTSAGGDLPYTYTIAFSFPQ